MQALNVKREEDLIGEVYTPARKGSLQMAMIAAARRHGRLAYQISDLESLWPEIAAGNPIVILLNLGTSWLPIWHYAVVAGYDTSREHVIMRSVMLQIPKMYSKTEFVCIPGPALPIIT